MNEQLRDQMSAFLDDELPGGESELLVRRLGRDPALHGAATRYLLVGQTLRGELLGDDPLAFVKCVSERIDADGADAAGGAVDEEVLASPVAAERDRSRWWRPAGGAAAAAAVALVAIVALQTLTRDPASDPPAMAATAPATVAPAAIGSAAVPGSAEAALPGATVTPNIRLTNYLMTHGEVAGSLGRKTIHSGIVGTSAAQIMGGYVEVTPPVSRSSASD